MRPEVLRAPRGTVYDRHGELLADSAPSFGIVFRPFPTESTQRVLETMSPAWLVRVGALVELDSAEVRRRVDFANRTGQSALLKRDAPFAMLAGVEETAQRAAGDRGPGGTPAALPLRHARRPPAGLRGGDQRRRAGHARGRGLQAGRPHRPHRGRAQLRGLPARAGRRGIRRGERARPAGLHAQGVRRAGAGAGTGPGAHARPQGAARPRGGDGRRPARRGGGARPARRRHPRAGEPAGLRPERVLARPEPRALEGAQRGRGQPAAGPGHPGRLSARVDLQDRHDDRGARPRRGPGRHAPRALPGRHELRRAPVRLLGASRPRLPRPGRSAPALL